MVLALATAGKSEICHSILMGDWDKGKSERMDWAWEKLQGLSTTPSHKTALEYVERNLELKDKMITYVCIVLSFVQYN